MGVDVVRQVISLKAGQRCLQMICPTCEARVGILLTREQDWHLLKSCPVCESGHAQFYDAEDNPVAA